MKIPLAERFHSIQGEGYWAGTPMHFIRLPGCTVGKPWNATPEGAKGLAAPTLPGLNHKPAWRCAAFDGKGFWCDTDFSKYLEEESEAIFADTWERHICLTGGEPLMHKALVDLFRTQCQIHSKTLHIETSGTIDMWWERDVFLPWTNRNPWITVSPKVGWTPYMIRWANELKLLVHPDTSEKNFNTAFLQHPRVYLSPINAIEGLKECTSQRSLDRAMELLHAHPEWKISVQLHKYLEMR